MRLFRSFPFARVKRQQRVISRSSEGGVALSIHDGTLLLQYTRPMMRSLCIQLATLCLFLSGTLAFAPAISRDASITSSRVGATLLHARNTKPEPKISQKRRAQLGINDDEDEYDLYFALDNNTDPFITKVIAGSLIVVLTGLLIAGVIVPSLTDYGEGVCSPIQNAGRC